MKKTMILLLFTLLFASCELFESSIQLEQLKKDTEPFNNKIKELEVDGKILIYSNSDLDVFLPYYDGYDIAYETSEDYHDGEKIVEVESEFLKVENNFLFAYPDTKSDRPVILKATFTDIQIEGVEVVYYYKLLIKASTLLTLSKPRIEIFRGETEITDFYYNNFPLQKNDILLFTPPPGASCIYTLDGSNPNSSETAIEGFSYTIEQSGNQIAVKVAATRVGYVNSPVLSFSYSANLSKPTLAKNSATYKMPFFTSSDVTSIKTAAIDLNSSNIDSIYEPILDSIDFTSGNYDDYYLMATDNNWAEEFDGVFAFTRTDTETSNAENPYQKYWLIKKEEIFSTTLPSESKTNLVIAVADALGTISDPLTIPCYLIPSSSNLQDYLLFDTSTYEATSADGYFTVTNNDDMSDGNIASTESDPYLEDYITSLEDTTIVFRFNFTSIDTLGAIFSIPSATTASSYFTVYKNATTIGYELKGGPTKGSLGGLTDVSNNTTHLFSLRIDSSSASYIIDRFSLGARVSVDSGNHGASFLSFRDMNGLGTPRVGSTGRFGAANNERWEASGKAQVRIYSKVLTDDELNTVMSSMNSLGAL